jgi:hypothetical protein
MAKRREIHSNCPFQKHKSTGYLNTVPTAATFYKSGRKVSAQ